MRIAVIGSGFSGLSASAYLAKYGHDVTLYEKNSQIGGRARTFVDQGFVFDMGPSWYWMPEVFEDFFRDFGSSTDEHYDLKRLDPSYQVIFKDHKVDVAAGRSSFLKLAEKLDPGSSSRVDRFLDDAEYKYITAMDGFVQKPSRSIREFVSLVYLKKAWRMDMLKSMRSSVKRVTKNPQLQSILEFPVLFLGATPSKIPAMYSMMNHADIDLGTWYPMGGMHKVVEGFATIAEKEGVQIITDAEVSSIESSNGRISGLVVNNVFSPFDAVVSGADYAHTESIIAQSNQQYSDQYWNTRSFAPSSLLYYIGLDTKVDGLKHHNLFFDADFDHHSEEIYTTHQWPKDPLFYVCCPSKTDVSVAPEGKENLFILIPVSTELEDSEEIRKTYRNQIFDRLKDHLGIDLDKHIEVEHSYARSNFIQDYHAFKGNAYGLANTLNQTAFLKPKMKSTKLNNMYFTGQLTVPGPGVPPAIISGKTVADLIQKDSTL